MTEKEISQRAFILAYLELCKKFNTEWHPSNDGDSLVLSRHGFNEREVFVKDYDGQFCLWWHYE